MNIELNETIETTIRTAMASGRFSTAEAFLEAATTDFLQRTVNEKERDKPTVDELKERFRPFRGKLKMSREELVEARHDGLA